MRRTTGGYLAAAGLSGLIPQSVAFAQPLSTVRVASGLSSPIAATHAPGDTGRMFIAEQGAGGTASIKILNLSNNTVNAVPFLSITGLQTGGEQGLLGLAFHPDYASNGKFYVKVSAPGGSFQSGISQIREYTAVGNPLTAVAANPASVRMLLSYDQPQTNHNGGWIGFNPKLTPTTPQYLYIANGDGGAGNDQGTGHIEPGGNAQNLTTVLGKMLRIDVNSDAFPADPARNYAIPANNPFVSTATARPEIWAYGLRNPWRSSFDRLTGDLYIGDVGQGQREEVNFQPGNSPGGENYQWRLREGTIQTPGVGGPAPANSVGPIHDYPNPAGNQAAVVGGHVFHGDSLVGRDGHYFFADTYNSQIWVLDYNGAFIQDAENVTAQLDPPGALSINTIVSFGEDALGRLYIVDIDGEVYRIVPEPASAATLALAGCTVLLRGRRRR